MGSRCSMQASNDEEGESKGENVGEKRNHFRVEEYQWTSINKRPKK